MATTVDFVHAYTAVNNSGLIKKNANRCSFLHKSPDKTIYYSIVQKGVNLWAAWILIYIKI